LTEIIICPVCKSELKRFTISHVKSQKHQKALKVSGISPENDPSLKYLKKVKETKTAKALGEFKNRLDRLEELVEILKINQEEIMKNVNTRSAITLEKPIRKKMIYKKEDILYAINRCVQNNTNESKWVMVDDIFKILNLNNEDERKEVNKTIIKLFNKNIIDLAEGGNPVHPIVYQNKIFGMIAIQ